MIDADKLYSTQDLSKKQLEARQIALNSFEAFVRLMAPYQLLGHCHVDLCKWIQRNSEDNLLVLWPRDHGKSRFCAFYAAWEVIRNPAIAIIYASATAEKAEEQLRFIKSILTSDIAFRYFPGLVHREEGLREAWNTTFIIVDHKARKDYGVIDSTIMTAGLQKTITGKHCDRLILDDIVVPENNTEQGRKDVNGWVAQAASITSANSIILGVGTRYHPRDAYQVMMDMAWEDEASSEDGVTSTHSLFKINMANVESDGQFLWPRSQHKNGKWYGFSTEILAKKKAVYEANSEITQFYAQYYNDPNDKSTAPIAREFFKYYNKENLTYVAGVWTIEGKPCFMYAAVDLATGVVDTSDYSVVVTGCIDTVGNRYVVDIKRFKTDKISVIEEAIATSYKAYKFKKLRIEAVAGFKLVAEDLADRLYDKGIRVPVDYYLPPKSDAKPVRINNILEPLYQSGAIYHFRGGFCQTLEDELVSANPPNDDLKDAWAMCVEQMVVPSVHKRSNTQNVLMYHPRYGGII